MPRRPRARTAAPRCPRSSVRRSRTSQAPRSRPTPPEHRSRLGKNPPRPGGHADADAIHGPSCAGDRRPRRSTGVAPPGRVIGLPRIGHQGCAIGWSRRRHLHQNSQPTQVIDSSKLDDNYPRGSQKPTGILIISQTTGILIKVIRFPAFSHTPPGLASHRRLPSVSLSHSSTSPRGSRCRQAQPGVRMHRGRSGPPSPRIGRAAPAPWADVPAPPRRWPGDDSTALACAR